MFRGSCIAGASYTMIADVYDQIKTFDPDTRETVRDWTFSKTIKCKAIPYIDGGIYGGGTTEEFNTEYDNLDYLRLKTQIVLQKRQRISNIRHYKTKELLWADEEGSGEPTVFNVEGCSPIINPVTGNPTEYLTKLSRAEVRE